MPQTTNVLGGGVAINEIHPNPFGPGQDYDGDGGADFNDLYIEIMNYSAGPIDISGWQLFLNGTSTPSHTFAPGTILPAGGRITVVDSEGGNVAITGVSGTAVFSTGNMLFGDGFNALLYDPGANQFTVVSGSTGAGFLPADISALQTAHPGATQFGTTETLPTAPNPPNGNSIQRTLDGEDTWGAAPATPGSANCFLTGTLIATPDGERRVEDLEIGDEILTASGEVVVVKWNARQTLRMFQRGPMTDPVRIRAGALGDGLPHTDLVVTADHGMLVDGLLINASALVNGGSIDFVTLAEMPGRITYHHIETASHDVILANGAPSESYLDIPGRSVFDNYQEYLDLYGAERIVTEMPVPRISSRRLVPAAIKGRLGLDEVGFDEAGMALSA